MTAQNYPVLHWRPKSGRLRRWLGPHLLRCLVKLGFASIDAYPYLEKPDMDLKAKGHAYNWFLMTGHDTLPLVIKMRAFHQAKTFGLPLDDCARRADPG